MRKFIKYEIKGTYKYILGVLTLVLILITGLYGYMSKTKGMSTLGNMFVSLSVLILFGTALITLFYIVGSFRKELHEDRGYLTFTLPLTGNQIVGSKLIVALMWFALLGVVIAAYNIIMVLSFSPVEINISEILSAIGEVVSGRTILFAILTSVFGGVNMLLLIYFSMALSRVTFRNKKIGGLWFVIFLVLSGLLTYIQYKIGTLLPYYMDLNTFSIGNMNTLTDKFMMEFNNGIMVSANMNMLTMNIAASIFGIVSTIGLFVGTGYLIEKRIDL